MKKRGSVASGGSDDDGRDDDAGDELGSALDDILKRVVYEQLVEMARRLRRGERSELAPGTFTVLHHALKRVAALPAARGLDEDALRSRIHQSMKTFLIDAARHRNAQKRKGEHVELAAQDIPLEQTQENVKSLVDALAALRTFNPVGHRVLELRFFAGYTVLEVADIMGIGKTKVNTATHAAISWLKVRLAM